jgi:hypothetical protein
MSHIRKLTEILALTKEMLGFASSNGWERVAELEEQRRELVGVCFSRPTNQQDSTKVAVLIKEILQINNQIAELGRKHLGSLGSEIHIGAVGKAARTAYLNCAG